MSPYCIFNWISFPLAGDILWKTIPVLYTKLPLIFIYLGYQKFNTLRSSFRNGLRIIWAQKVENTQIKTTFYIVIFPKLHHHRLMTDVTYLTSPKKQIHQNSQ